VQDNHGRMTLFSIFVIFILVAVFGVLIAVAIDEEFWLK
jgi:hypothetical protein